MANSKSTRETFEHNKITATGCRLNDFWWRSVGQLPNGKRLLLGNEMNSGPPCSDRALNEPQFEVFVIVTEFNLKLYCTSPFHISKFILHLASTSFNPLWFSDVLAIRSRRSRRSGDEIAAIWRSGDEIAAIWRWDRGDLAIWRSDRGDPGDLATTSPDRRDLIARSPRSGDHIARSPRSGDHIARSPRSGDRSALH